MPHALLIKFPGTNCDAETARALEAAGFTAEVLPVALLEPAALDRAKMIVFSGGFSYGDYVMSGRIAQLITKSKLGERLKKFVKDGGYVLGICNGFQILTQARTPPARQPDPQHQRTLHLPLGAAEEERQHQPLPARPA